ncbi:MAG: 3-oxoacyl-ACP synthase III family protein [Planctomycetota bacterium]|jgi:3-oxoacyl-[acyl-carrier-protein] synthase-3
MRAFLNRSVAVLGTGSYLPDRVVTNDILRDWCTNYDDSSGDFSTWVDRVTHIHERRFIADGETAGHMAAKAAERALDMAGLKPTDLDLIIHASFTPSAVVPGDHVLVADLLGANKTPSFTLNVACSGSIYALATAYGMIASKAMRRILVTGSETISPVLDYRDPLTAILFGDGAGAVVIGDVGTSEGGMAPPYMGFDFNWENITMANANLPFTGKVVVPAANGNPPAMEKTFLTMISGPKVMRSAVNAMANSVRRVLGYDEGALPDDVRARMRVIPHQANGRIVDGLAKKLKVDPLKVTKTIYKVGNISAASNVIALDYAMRHGNLTADRDPETERILAICEVEDPIQRGELVVLPSIGAGYLFGAVAFVNTI